MGMDLDLYVDDESIESPHLSRSFKDEIIFDWYLNFESFLSEEEIKLVSPNTYGEITMGEKKPFKEIDKSKILDKISDAVMGKGSLGKVNDLFDDFLITSEKVEDRERNPKKLKEVLQKIENYLISKSSELPLVHNVYKGKDYDDEIFYLMIDGVKSHLEGDLFHNNNYNQIRNKIQVKSYLNDYGKVNFLIDVKPQIIIADKVLYTKSITKAEQFEDEFKRCYDFLDLAIGQNKRVLWEFG